MKKMDPQKARAYFRLRTMMICIYLGIGALVSFVVVLAAESLQSFTVMGLPLPYYMGAQGAVLTFIVLLFFNAMISDMVDKKFGLIPKQNSEQKSAVNE
ncbi:putative solute:sodium symporter small subunit [Halobacillus karajensis]|uniref:Solute:sodium symporter small subunit n=1 Tax=Halobacillus karajensis TaxID=195088 RepID=A0A059NVD7_9BACI|nr:sodium/substrate symporter small subunit [Halobacillus karajensis]CDQ18887.1 putative solute:sodium symporter small subunit [Halobacillus karajensis]CDQ23040.1 putative solute:sodium symporter small subunit [Halobacillus karajensis]CDQ26522.1 putative solute:sodium symporter small subunit [Halobacillus karajensis]SEH44765.1 putative solute:sodium symporter small subunit [Halobacillus karajensis]